MLRNWCEFLSPDHIEQIHKTSMRVMENVGVKFPHDEAIAIFEEHGFKTDGQNVYFKERQVMDALWSVPKPFTIYAPNSDKNVVVGDGSPVFAAGYGAPRGWVAEPGYERASSRGTLERAIGKSLPIEAAGSYPPLRQTLHLRNSFSMTKCVV
ncbi:MAG: trimethylamine methyltransferase family protein [Anaerolineae bacterium]|jgi:trimethylamine:corrinoid methyltransferase-like protein